MGADTFVATTILSQLGGNRFVACTGSKVATYTNNSITLKLTRNKSKANEMTITLNGADLYDITFAKHIYAHLNKKTWAWVPDKYEVVQTYDDIFCDQLEELFTDFTGLITRLF